jgi:hypothetical protein
MQDTMHLEQVLLDNWRSLSLEQQKQVLNFIEFLRLKAKELHIEHSEGKSISALESAGDLVGCLNGLPEDLSYNKKYL